MSSPSVSVVIPAYNRAHTLNRAIDSVLNQTFEDFELIVVDDGSTDETQRVLREYGDRIKRVRQDRSGVSAARNRGLAECRARFIALLDSDDAWLPDKLAVQVEFFNRNADALICQTEEIWIRNGRRVNPKNVHKKPSGDIFILSLKLCLVSPSAVMMKRELFELVGVFDETLPACEDFDLWLRTSARYPVYLIEDPQILKYGGHEDQLSRTVEGLDQYRVKAILKIIESGVVEGKRLEAAKVELSKKAWIYGQGCLKRGKAEEGRRYLDLANDYGFSG